MKKIHVWLPKNRLETGSLTLFWGRMEPYFSCPVRGKADNNEARKHKNKHRDVTLPYGDTPAGACEPAEWIPISPRAREYKSFGQGFLRLQGVSGAFKDAMDNGRTGMGLHGGAGECLELPGKLYLKATYGCLRVRDSDLNRLMDLTEGEKIEVTIFDV